MNNCPLLSNVDSEHRWLFEHLLEKYRSVFELHSTRIGNVDVICLENAKILLEMALEDAIEEDHTYRSVTVMPEPVLRRNIRWMMERKENLPPLYRECVRQWNNELKRRGKEPEKT